MVEDFGGQAEHAGGAAAPVPPAPRTEFRTADGHTVRLHPKVTIPMGVAGIEAIGSVMGQGMAAFKAVISDVYLDYGIAWWDFTDERGEPEPIDHWSIARLL